MQHQQEVMVHIRNIAVGGEGVGEVTEQFDGDSDLLGITAFVPYTAVGDKVRARITELKKRHVKTELLAIAEASATRVEPPCPQFGKCGGCELQHIDYRAQLDAKYKMIRGALQAAKVSSETLAALTQVVASEPYGYRRRVSLHVDASGAVGFYRGKTRSIVSISRCEVAAAAINEVLPAAAEFGREAKGRVSGIELDADNEGVVAVIKCTYAAGERERQELLRVAKKHFSNVSLRVGAEEIGGAGRTILQLPLNDSQSIKLRVPAGNFSQINSEINLQLIEAAISGLGELRGKVVYDLYAGAGNFSLPLARTGAAVIAVETDPQLVALGKQNAERYHSAGSLKFVESSVKKFLQAPQKSTPYAIVADPPRSGRGRVVDMLPSGAEKLVLVSCHLPSCVRDVRALQEKGWRLTRMQPFDMFAQTSYVEVLSEFVRA